MPDTPKPPLPYDHLAPVPSFTVTSDDVADAAPRSGAHADDGVAVCTVTVAAVSDAFKAARYSRVCSKEVR